MLRRLGEKLAADRLDNVEPVRGGFLSYVHRGGPADFAYSRFALHHLPDFWKAVALSRMFRALKPGGRLFLRDIVFVGVPDGAERDIAQWADFNIKNHDFPREDVATHMRDEHSTFGWVIERMLTDVGFTLISADYHAPLHGTYLCRKPDASGMQ
jgi:SAM-dependent methyltransferase